MGYSLCLTTWTRFITMVLYMCSWIGDFSLWLSYLASCAQPCTLSVNHGCLLLRYMPFQCTPGVFSWEDWLNSIGPRPYNFSTPSLNKSFASVSASARVVTVFLS